MNSQTPQGPDSKSHDEAALRALYQQIIDGWNKGSGDAFAAPYTEDSDYIGFDGTHMKGDKHTLTLDYYVIYYIELSLLSSRSK